MHSTSGVLYLKIGEYVQAPWAASASSACRCWEGGTDGSVVG